MSALSDKYEIVKAYPSSISTNRKEDYVQSVLDQVNCEIAALEGQLHQEDLEILREVALRFPNASEIEFTTEHEVELTISATKSGFLRPTITFSITEKSPARRRVSIV